VGLLSLFSNWKPRHSRQPLKLFVSLWPGTDTSTLAFSKDICWCGWLPTVRCYLLRAAVYALTSQTMFMTTDILGDIFNVLCQNARLWSPKRLLCFMVTEYYFKAFVLQNILKKLISYTFIKISLQIYIIVVRNTKPYIFSLVCFENKQFAFLPSGYSYYT